MSQQPMQMGNQFDRLPPHSIEAEQCTIASMLLEKECIGDVVQIIDRDCFYQTDHQILFDVLLSLFNSSSPIDTTILREELTKRGLWEEIGGAPYIGQLLNTVPSASHAKHYAGIVREKYVLRSLIAASNETLREAYAPHEKADYLLDRAEHRIFDIAERRVQSEMTPINVALEAAFERIEDRGKRGLDSGYHEIDDLLNGMQDGEMIVVAARPSIGKTAFALNVIEHVSANLKIPSAIFSLEMSRQQLAQRMLCGRADVDAHKVRKGMCSAEEFGKLATVVSEMSKVPIYIDDSPDLTIMNLRAKCRRLKRSQDVKLVVIDYLQMMSAPEIEDGRQQQITAISRGIKSVARELMIPIIAISQLNRASESRDGHKPRMSDLRESGSIEQDADVIMLMHREDYYRASQADFMPDNIAEVIIAKQRNGPTGSVKLHFDLKTTRFRNLDAQLPLI